MYVYETIYNIDNRTYVGMSTKDHEKTKNYYGSGLLIIKAIKCHGKENFTKRILEILPKGSTKKQCGEREQYWIKQRDSKYPKGFNLADGGEGVQLFGKNNPMFGKRGKLAPGYGKRGKKSYSYGKPSWCKGLTKETDERVKINAEKRFGQKRSKKSKKRMSLSHHDVSGKNNPMYRKGYLLAGEKHWLYNNGHLISGNKNPMFGRKHSKETKEKIRKAALKRSKSNV